MKREPSRNCETRELTDKELGEMTSAMGDNVRLLSVTVSNIIQANLKSAFAAHRENVAFVKTR